jgi:hypothetical protein
MNERIRELADEAAKYSAIMALPTGQSGNELFVAKFAELIVRECGLWFNNRLVVNPDYGIEHRVERNRAVIGVMKEFNQHFGVEE